MINLHVHSMYSLRDSIIKPEELVDRLKEINQSAVAITDHGGSLGGISIYKMLKNAGIKYIHGVEFYICDDVTVRDKNNKYSHLVALCKNDIGRKNMNTLISLSEHPSNKYIKPRIDFSMLSQYGDGLVILSACVAGEVCKALEDDDYDLAKQIATKYKNRFGEDYYLEVQSHRESKQIELNKKILSLAKELDIQVVVTSDAHHTYEEDRKYQQKYAFNGAYKEDGESYVDCFVQSEDDARGRLDYLPTEIIDSLIATTHLIADKCCVEMPLSAPIMPQISTPEEYFDNKEWLESLCREGFASKLNIDLVGCCQLDMERKIFQPVYDENGRVCDYAEKDLEQSLVEKYIDRYNYELDCLDRMGFIDYILLVYSYANIAKRRGIARGSGGGSLICYLTNITNIDPIEHGLYFERFIDVGALALLESGEITAKELKIPDIDLDFSGDSCDEVLRFIYEKYGESRVASIGKFGTNQTKGTIRDMCRVLDIDLATADKIAKSFENYEITEIDQMILGEINMPVGAKEAVSYVRKYDELFEYVRKLNGLPKSFGLHACGKIISVSDLDESLPSCYDEHGIRYLQGDMHDVEDVGLVKIDVLGLRTLDQEYDTLEMSGESSEFINPKQRYNDDKVLDIFRKGDTLGIFQFSSFGMKKTLQKMDVQGIDDLSIANALYRPGSMQYIDNFCRRRNGEEKFEYLHPDLEGILSSTYGVIVFQEQLIEIGRMAGIHNPDLLRKATGKKNPALLAQVKPELEEKLYARGWIKEQFDKLWADMLEFAKYSFNKAHSSAYGILAYITAKQKAYYPAEFFAGLCNSYINHSAFVKEEAEEIVADMCRHKVMIAPFDFRDDHRRCWVKDGKVVYAIPLIRDCNLNAAEILYKNSNTKEKMFWRLVVNMKQSGMSMAMLQILIKLNFFGEYGTPIALMKVMNMLDFMKYGERKNVNKEKVGGLAEDFLIRLLSKYSVTQNNKGQELKSYSKIDVAGFMDEFELYIRENCIRDYDYRNKMAIQCEYLGFVNLITQKEEDRAKLLVLDVAPLKRKKDHVQFGYSIITRSIGSGKESRFTVFNRLFNNDPISNNDIIHCLSFSREGPYFTLTNYKHIYN